MISTLRFDFMGYFTYNINRQATQEGKNMFLRPINNAGIGGERA